MMVKEMEDLTPDEPLTSILTIRRPYVHLDHGVRYPGTCFCERIVMIVKRWLDR
jgi:hypothetical protein